MPLHRNKDGYLQFDPVTYDKARELLVLFEAKLRDAEVHDALRNADLKHKYDTRFARGKLSLLCSHLVFGAANGQTLWRYLHNGGPDESRFFMAVEFLHRFFDGAPDELRFDPLLSRQLSKMAGLKDRLDGASAMFLAKAPLERLNSLRRDLIEIRDSRNHGISPLEEGDIAQQNALTFSDATGPEFRLSSDLLASNYRIQRYQAGTGLWSSLVSEMLVDKGAVWNPHVSYHARPFEAFDRAIGFRRLNDARRAGAEAFNRNKVGLRSDILVAHGELPASISLQCCDYVDTLGTNDVARLRVGRIYQDGDGTAGEVEHLTGWKQFCATDGTLSSFTDSKCANQLGASVVAITDDGVALLVQQLGRNIQSANKIAPSGSGSFDFPDDFEELKEMAFGKWLLSTSQRELREELGIYPHRQFPDAVREQMHGIRLSTMFIGFGALMHRGGVPNFYFLGRVHCTLRELLEIHHYEATEKSLSAILRDIKDEVLPNMRAAHLQTFCMRQSVERKERNSVPLAMAFDMVAHLCVARRTRIDDFLQGGETA